MTSGPGVAGRTRATRGGGGGPILIPIETCASTAPTVANSIAARSAVLIEVLMFSLLHDIVRTKRRNASGGAICNCQRYRWPHVQVPVPSLKEAAFSAALQAFEFLDRPSLTKL